jgi:putative ATP-dependent endonuclease of the OLD family
MGGVGNLRYFAADSTLAFLSRRQVGIWFVIDRDEKDDEQLRQIQKRLGSKAHLIALDRRQVENYLLDADAALRLIQEKSRSSSVDTSKIGRDDIERALYEQATAAIPTVIERRSGKSVCAPLYFPGGTGGSPSDRLRSRLEAARSDIDRRLVEIDAHVSRIESEVRDGWQDKWKTWVDGANVLDCVFREYGLRFTKERDSVRLATYISHIPPEFKSFFAHLGDASSSYLQDA